MMPSNRATTSSYRLSIVTVFPCAAVWPQFSMQGFNLLVAISQKRSALPSDSWFLVIYQICIACAAAVAKIPNSIAAAEM